MKKTQSQKRGRFGNIEGKFSGEANIEGERERTRE